MGMNFFSEGMILDLDSKYIIILKNPLVLNSTNSKTVLSVKKDLYSKLVFELSFSETAKYYDNVYD